MKRVYILYIIIRCNADSERKKEKEKISLRLLKKYARSEK